MYTYEHLMQKHLLYKYTTLGILFVLPPWVMSFLQPLGFIYHGRTNPISLSVTVPWTYRRAQLPLLSWQSQTDKAQGDQHLHHETAPPAAPTLQKAMKISQTPWKYLHFRSMPEISKLSTKVGPMKTMTVCFD